MNALHLLGPISIAAVLLANCSVEDVPLGESNDPVTPDSGQSSACEEPSPAGCVQTGCATGQVCDTRAGCTPSECTCDRTSGTWTCTDDCGGGSCVPATRDAAAGSCTEPSPAGCVQNACPPDRICDTTLGCKPSECHCNAETDTWSCTRDCGGGECVLIEPPGDCPTDWVDLGGQPCSTPGTICEYGRCVLDWHANLRCVDGTWQAEQINCMSAQPCGAGRTLDTICVECGPAGGCGRSVMTCAKPCQTSDDCTEGELRSCVDGSCQVGGCF